jgi:anti-sigma B factor antagonist
VDRRSSDGHELLVVSGEIDIATSARLIAALNDAVTDATRSLVVDIAGVQFMDSTGLALLLDANRRLRSRDVGFAVVSTDGPVKRVFEVTDMIDMLNVRPDRESAAAAANGR